MDYASAVDLALREVRDLADPEGDAVRAALQLGLHAWHLCDSLGAGFTDDELGTAGAVITDVVAQPTTGRWIIEAAVPSSTLASVRLAAAGFAITVAACLQLAAGNPDADGERRQAWAAAANRLERAAAELIGDGDPRKLGRTGSMRVQVREAAARFADHVAGRLELAADSADMPDRQRALTVAATRLRQAAPR